MDFTLEQKTNAIKELTKVLSDGEGIIQILSVGEKDDEGCEFNRLSIVNTNKDLVMRHFAENLEMALVCDKQAVGKIILEAIIKHKLA